MMPRTVNATIAVLFAVALVAGIWVAQCRIPDPSFSVSQLHEKSGENAKADEELHRARKRIRKIDHRLLQINRKAEQENPELARMHSQIMHAYRNKLEAYGYQGESKLNELRARRAYLQKTRDIAHHVRQRKIEELDAEIKTIEQAKRKAWHDPEVQKILFRQERDKTKAMAEIDKATPELMRRKEELQAEIAELQQKQQLQE